MHCSISTFTSHTGILCSGLSRGWTGLSEAYSVTSHHPELVVHPGVQTHHCSCQHVTIDHFWHCEKRTVCLRRSQGKCSNKSQFRASLEPAERLISVTRVCSLPAYGKRGPGLDDITGDRAAIIPSGSPGQLGGAVCDLLHGYLVRRTWRTLFNHVMERINSGCSNIPGGPPSSNS